MCFVLYVGTASPLPLRPWRQEAPALSVEEMSADKQAIKAHFASNVVQYVGSTSGCGCDFPHVLTDTWRSPMFQLEAFPETDASERSNAQELVTLLRASGEKTIEVYGVWDGDFTEAPEARESIFLSRILDPHFRFKEKGFYTVQVD
jgi:hypothetical protein